MNSKYSSRGLLAGSYIYWIGKGAVRGLGTEITRYFQLLYICVETGGEPTRNNFHRNILYFTFCGSLMEITSSKHFCRNYFLICNYFFNIQQLWMNYVQFWHYECIMYYCTHLCIIWWIFSLFFSFKSLWGWGGSVTVSAWQTDEKKKYDMFYICPWFSLG